MKIDSDGTVHHEFYQKKAKADLIPHHKSAMPTQTKRTILRNEVQRRKARCSTPDKAKPHLDKFLITMTDNGYPRNFLNQPQRDRYKPQTTPKDYLYFDFPYLNDATDQKIKKIFRDLDMNVRISRRPHTLRNALQHKERPDPCNLQACQLKNDMCHTQNCVYKITCKKCEESYIGSTKRALHTRIKEHLTDEKSSVYAHQQQCHADLDFKIIGRERDPVKLRFKEAIFISEQNPRMNSRAERDEIQHLIFRV